MKRVELDESNASDATINESSEPLEKDLERIESQEESQKLMTHDRFVYRLWTELNFAKRFFRAFLPKEILERVDLDDMVQLPSRQVDESGGEHISDSFYKIKLKAGHNMVFVVLMEHKSTYERLVPFQMLRYETMAIDYMSRNSNLFRDDDGLYPAPFSILLCQDEHPQLEQLLRRVDGVEYGVRMKYHTVNVQKTDLEQIRSDSALYTALKLAKMARYAANVDADLLCEVFLNYINTNLDDEDFAKVFVHACLNYTSWFMREQNFNRKDFGEKLVNQTMETQEGSGSMEDAIIEFFGDVIETKSSREVKVLRAQLEERERNFQEQLEKRLVEQLAAMELQYQSQLVDRDVKLANKDAELADKDAELANKDAELANKDAELADKDAEIAKLRSLMNQS